MEALDPASADAHGRRRRPDAHQHARGARSFVRREERFRPHPEIRHRRHAAEAHGRQEIQAQERLAALFRTRLRHVLPLHVLVRNLDLQLPHAALPAALRQRLLLGRFGHALSGTSGSDALQPRDPSRIRNRALTLTPQLVREAAERIRPLAHRTPVMTSRSVDERAGTQVFLKCENFQRSGAFKIRGASNLILSLSPEQLKNGVVAFSSGNHAIATAIAAKYVGATATIVMPEDAPRAKMETTRALGARIV